MNRVTVVRKVVPVPGRIDRIDAWRWEGVLDFDAYCAKVLADEAARASRRAS
jgi:hypothetical protein